MTSLSARVLTTLAYSAVFKFSLTLEELQQRLVLAVEHPSLSELSQTLADLKARHLVWEQDGLLTLASAPESIPTRLAKKPLNAQKWQEVQAAVACISQAPGLLGIAVTGSVAVNNAEAESDLDFMLVVEPHMIWICRMWVIWQSWRRGKRRSFAHEEKNSWCFNLWLGAESLDLDRAQRSLYTAYEVCQAVWVWQKAPVAQRFLQLNHWAAQYVPQLYQRSRFDSETLAEQVFASPINPRSNWIKILINQFFYQIQYLYMLPHMTQEIVRYDRAFFHPRPTKNSVMQRCRTLLSELLQ